MLMRTAFTCGSRAPRKPGSRSPLRVALPGEVARGTHDLERELSEQTDLSRDSTAAGRGRVNCKRTRARLGRSGLAREERELLEVAGDVDDQVDSARRSRRHVALTVTLFVPAVIGGGRSLAGLKGLAPQVGFEPRISHPRPPTRTHSVLIASELRTESVRAASPRFAPGRGTVEG
jgi:hypothetical protein